MNNSNHNSSCHYAELLVSYLYGEAGQEEKARFEAHLIDCDRCADEITAFGSMRASIGKWREVEFSTLQNPLIDFRPDQAAGGFDSQADSAQQHTWLEQIRALFAFSRNWTYGLTAAGAILIFSGLFFIAVNFLNQGNEVSSTNTNSVVPVPSPSIDSEEPITESAGKTELPQAVTPAKNESTAATRQKSTPTLEPRRVKPAVALQRPVAKSGANQVVQKNLSKEKPATAFTPRTPRPVDLEFGNRAEERESTLRLTDLLDEVSMRK